jgi:aspartate carbamoyltransferase catalytic subunit
MSGWPHRHVLDLASFSREDFAAVLELAQRFRSLPITWCSQTARLAGPFGGNAVLRAQHPNPQQF